MEVEESVLKELILTNSYPERYQQFKDIFPVYQVVARLQRYTSADEYEFITLAEPASLEEAINIRNWFVKDSAALPEEAKKQDTVYKLFIRKFDWVRMTYHYMNY